MTGSELISFLSNNISTIKSTVGAVAGSLFTAIFLRHNTSVQEFEKVKAGQFKELADLLLKEGKMTYTEYYKANNFLSVAKKADEYYSQMKHETPVESYSFDWFLRFYEAAGNISDEEMQDLWAKILAGEINKPTSFSLRMIDILRNLSKQEADLFQKICCNAIHMGNNIIIPRNDIYMEKCNITFSDIMRLDELGLMNSAGLLELSIPLSTTSQCITSNNSYFITVQSNNSSTGKLSIHQFPLTMVGKELARLQNVDLPDDMLITFAKEIRNKNGVEVHLYKILEEVDDGFRYDPIDVLDSL